MSALADDPQDLLRYCQKCDASVGAADFVLRKCYGDYLAALLNMSADVFFVMPRCIGTSIVIGWLRALFNHFKQRWLMVGSSLWRDASKLMNHVSMDYV